MISPEEAKEIILKEVRALPLQEVDILTSLNHVLAEDIVAGADIPPFDNSAMDGFAVNFSDVQAGGGDGPVELKIIADLPAGTEEMTSVLPGQVVQISTGAPVSKGTDTVVKIEDCRVENGKVQIVREPRVGENIRRQGEDISRGNLVARCGQVISPAEIGLFASLSIGKVQVITSPEVAVVSTGNELTELEDSLTSGKIRDSNSYTLAAQVVSCGANPKRLGIARDSKDKIREKIAEGLGSDVLITTGGVSVGKHDLVKEVLAEMGAELKFWRVAQKPGKPFAFWTFKDKPVFGFPGNPVASMVCFEEYVRPAILKMSGKNKLFRPETEAILEHDIKKKPDRMHYLRVEVIKKDGKHYAKTTGEQGSGILTSMSKANGLAIFPKGQAVLKKGEKVKVKLINLNEDH